MKNSVDTGGFRHRLKTSVLLLFCIVLMPCALATGDLKLLRGSSDEESNKNYKIQVSEVLKSKNDFLEKAEMALVSSSSMAVTADRNEFEDEESQHESSMILHAHIENAESIDTNNVLKNDFVQQAKMASLTGSTVLIDQSKGIMLSNGEDGLDSNVKDKNTAQLLREKENGSQVSDILSTKDSFPENAQMILVSSSSMALTSDATSSVETVDLITDSSPDCENGQTQCDETYRAIADLRQIDIKLDTIIGKDESPKDIMVKFEKISKMIGVFLPGFTALGDVLAGFAEVDGSDDKATRELKAEFKQVNAKLDTIISEIDKFPGLLCKDRFDEWKSEYLGDFKTAFDAFTLETNDFFLNSLKSQCKDHPPFAYIGKWRNAFTDSSGDFIDCVKQFKSDANGRLLFFRKNYTTKILANILKASEYSFICQGINPFTVKEEPIENFFDSIKSSLLQIEDEMYSNFNSGSMKGVLQSKYPQAKTDQNKALSLLREEFFPEFRYATVRFELDKIVDGQWKTLGTFMFYGNGNSEYGSFVLDLHEANGRYNFVVVFYRNRNNRQTLSALPSFENCSCGYYMCDRKGGDSCGYSHCSSPWHQVAENSKRNNKNMYDLYASRGALLLKTQSQYATSVDSKYNKIWFNDMYDCPYYRTHYAWKNDNIIKDVHVPGPEVDESEGSVMYTSYTRAAYQVIGIEGSFECGGDKMCSDNKYCGSKCSGTAPTPSTSCSPNGNPTCENNNYCKPGKECKLNNSCHSKPPPPPPPSPGPCFSSTSMVNHKSHGLVPISDINIGDSVQSKSDGSFSRVYALEKNHYSESQFYQFHTSKGVALELTDRHMVYLKDRSLPVPARDVRVGDVLKSDDHSEEVTKIEVIHQDGYYNPLTEDGTIILNDGVVASSFSVAKSSSSEFFDGPTGMIHWHTLSHLGNAPLRFVCKAVSFNVCTDENYLNEVGLHKFIVFLKTLSNLPNWQQVAVLPVIFGAGVLFIILDYFYDLVGEVFYAIISSTSTEAAAAAQHDGSFGFLITFSLTVAALVPSAIFLWRKKYHLSYD